MEKNEFKELQKFLSKNEISYTTSFSYDNKEDTKNVIIEFEEKPFIFKIEFNVEKLISIRKIENGIEEQLFSQSNFQDFIEKMELLINYKRELSDLFELTNYYKKK